jgi:hypothetical protein
MGLTPSRYRLCFTASSAIVVVNSVVGGAALGIAAWAALDASLAAVAILGAVVLAVSAARSSGYAVADGFA